eukprot:219765_1
MNSSALTFPIIMVMITITLASYPPSNCTYTITNVASKDYQGITLDLTPLSRSLIQYPNPLNKSINTLISFTPCESVAPVPSYVPSSMIYVPGSYQINDGIYGTPNCWPTFSKLPFPTYNPITLLWTFQYDYEAATTDKTCCTSTIINWKCARDGIIFSTLNASYSQTTNVTTTTNYYMNLEWTIESQYAC